MWQEAGADTSMEGLLINAGIDGDETDGQADESPWSQLDTAVKGEKGKA